MKREQLPEAGGKRVARTNEAFSRVKIDDQLRDQGWDVLDTNAVRFEYILPDNTRADYVLCDRHGRALAVVEAKKAALNSAEAEAQARAYAQQLQVPYVFLANGDEIRLWEWQREAYPRPVRTFFSQGDLERRAATAQVKREPLPQILVSVNMLDTGFDCPEVVNLVFARFTRSAILYQQMRGRGTRKARGKAAFTMFDFVGVTDYHGDDDEAGEGGFIKETPRKYEGQPRKLLALDIDDHIDPTTRAWITVDEDGNLMFPEASEQRRAEVGARFEAWLLEREDQLAPDQARWLRTVGSQLRANADAWDEFSPGHFAFPPFTLTGGLPEALRVFDGEDALNAVLADLNAAAFSPNRADAEAASSQPDLNLYS
jgi:cell wall-associated NlpC family hydrolase